jgi:hypothetical protein
MASLLVENFDATFLFVDPTSFHDRPHRDFTCSYNIPAEKLCGGRIIIFQLDSEDICIASKQMGKGIKTSCSPLPVDKQALLITPITAYSNQTPSRTINMSDHMISAHDLEGKTVAFVNFATRTAIDLKDGMMLSTLYPYL